MRRKILIVEDNKDICELMKTVLEEENFDVSYLRSAKTFDQVFSATNPDLVLLDLGLKGYDGVEIIKEIGKKVPVILISANHRTREIAQEYEAADFLEKPFDLSEFLEKVRNHADNDTIYK